MVDINNIAIFIFPDGFYRTIDLSTNPRIRGLRRGIERPIIAIIPESKKGTEFHLRDVRFALHPYNCDIQFRADSEAQGRLRPTVGR